MAHNLSENNGKVEMFSGENIVPWHGLGQVVAGLLTAEEAIKAAHLDWTVGLRPVEVDSKKVEGYHAVTRNDNNAVLSIVGDRYHPIQNVESFGFFDEVVGTGQAVYTTAGALGKGERVWIMAKIKGSLFIDTRRDDEHEKLILLSTSHDGTSSLMMQTVLTRVVCQNTLSIALRGATNQIKVRHTKSYGEKATEAQRILKLVYGYYDDLAGVMAALDKVNMPVSDAEAFTEKLIPATVDEKGKTATRSLNARANIINLFQNGKGNNGRTRLDMLNGVTDYVDHARGTRVTEGGDKQESRFISSVFGSGAAFKQRAMNLLLPA